MNFTLRIVVDPSAAITGSQQAVNAINNIITASNSLNTALQQTGNRLKNISPGQNINRLQIVTRSLLNDFSALGQTLALIQPARIFGGFIDELIRVDRQYNSFLAMMTVTTGSINESAKAYEYVKKTSRDYGVSIESLNKSYAKLAGSTKDLLSQSQTDALFESFTAVSSVLHTDKITTDRIFNAIIQMASKGQIHMEELKQQLGEHLPGALAIAADAMDMKIGEMIDKMKKGQISAEALLIPLPQKLMERFGVAAEITSKSLNAAITNLKNTVFDLFKDTSTSGASLGIAELARSVDEFLQPASASAKALGEAIGTVALELAAFVRSLDAKDITDFVDTLKQAGTATLWLSQQLIQGVLFVSKYFDEFSTLVGVIATFRYAIVPASAAVTALATNVTLGTVALAGLLTAGKLVAAFFIGWQVGTYLSENFEAVNKFGIDVAELMAKIPVWITHGFEIASKNIPLILTLAFEKTLNLFYEFVDKVRSMGAGVAEFFGFSDVVIKPSTRFDFTSGLRAERDAALEAYQKEISSIEKIFDEMRAESAAKFAAKSAGSANSGKTVAQALGIDAEEAKKQLSLAEEFMAKYKAVEDKFFADNASKKGSGGTQSKPAYFEQAKNLAQELMDDYREFYALYDSAAERGLITSSQMLTAQMAMLSNYTEAAIAAVTDSKSKLSTPKEIEKANAEILRLERQRTQGLIALDLKLSKERKAYLDGIEQAEIDSGIRRLSIQEKFVRDWLKSVGPLMTKANLEGDVEAMDRILAAFNYQFAKVDISETFMGGWNQALESFADAAKNTADIGTAAFKLFTDTAADGFITLASTGKLNIREMVADVLISLAKLIASKEFSILMSHVLTSITPGYLDSSTSLLGGSGSSSGSSFSNLPFGDLTKSLAGNAALYAGSALGTGTMAGGFLTGMGTAFSSGAGTAATWSAGSALASTAGGGAAGTGMMVGAAMPYVAIALAVLSMLDWGGGTPHAGAVVISGGAGDTVSPVSDAEVRALYATESDPQGLAADQFRENDFYKRRQQGVADALTPVAEAMADQFNTWAKMLGADGSYRIGLGFSADDDDSSRGRASILDQNTNELIDLVQKYSSDPQAGLEQFISSLAPVLRDGLLAAAPDMEEWQRNALEGLGTNFDVEGLNSALTYIEAISDASDAVARKLGMTAEDVRGMAEQSDLSKMAQQLSAFNLAIESASKLGVRFDPLAEGAMAASTELMTLVGGLDAFVEMQAAAYSVIVPQAEKFYDSQVALADAFAALGIAVPTSTTEFQRLIQAQDLMSDAGRNAYISLISLAPAFYELATAIEATFASISRTTAESVRGIEMALLDNAGKYAYLDSEIESLLAELDTAFDPTHVQELFEEINSKTVAAFNLLDESEQQRLGTAFIDRLYEAEALAQERLSIAPLDLKPQADVAMAAAAAAEQQAAAAAELAIAVAQLSTAVSEMRSNSDAGADALVGAGNALSSAAGALASVARISEVGYR